MTEKHWWTNYPWRMIQTNLREIDMAEIDAETYAQQLADYGATVVTLNAAGIIASYQTKLEFQTQSPYLTGSSLREILDACHKRGIRVIARTDFSKLREDVFARHPDWAYRDKDGNIVNYNGNIQTCPNGGYQQEKSLEILHEVLTTHPFDGVFCNMSGFLVVDYGGVYHGPCHCENCKRLFREQYGWKFRKRTTLVTRTTKNMPHSRPAASRHIVSVWCKRSARSVRSLPSTAWITSARNPLPRSVFRSGSTVHPATPAKQQGRCGLARQIMPAWILWGFGIGIHRSAVRS